MNLADLWLSAWPGLPRLWLRGDGWALLYAVLFAVALNLALIHTFLWPEWAPLPSPLWIWPMLLLAWAVSGWHGVSQIPDLLQVPQGAQPQAGQPDFLSEAQTTYLRGHWEEAELLLRRQLHHYPDDIPAGMLLATLLRHQGQLLQARQQLQELQRWDAAQWWEFEIEREVAAIERAQNEDSSELAADLQ